MPLKAKKSVYYDSLYTDMTVQADTSNGDW